MLGLFRRSPASQEGRDVDADTDRDKCRDRPAQEFPVRVVEYDSDQELAVGADDGVHSCSEPLHTDRAATARVGGWSGEGGDRVADRELENLLVAEPRGLPNLGNTCFTNAILQALAHTPSLYKQLLQNYLTRQQTGSSSTSCTGGLSGVCVRCILEHSLVDLRLLKSTQTYPDYGLRRSTGFGSILGFSSSSYSSSSSTYHSLMQSHPVGKVIELFPVLSSPAQSFILGEQEDAHEFLLQIIAALGVHNSESAPSPAAVIPERSVERSQSQDEAEIQRSLDCSSNIGTVPVFRSKSRGFLDMVDQEIVLTSSNGIDSTKSLDVGLDSLGLFQGALTSRVQCLRCGTVSDRVEEFSGLQIDISRVENLPDAIDQFCETEYLIGSNAYRCDTCNRKADAKKLLKISSLPEILVIQMKRFGHNGSYGSKIGKFVEYSHALTMEPYLLAKEGETCVAGREDLPLDKKLRSLLPRIAKEPERTQYKLSAVVCHKGSTIYRGHYTCFVQGANKLWYEVDDEKVQSIDSNQVLKQQDAYLLFYQRKGQSKRKKGDSSPKVIVRKHLHCYFMRNF